MRTSTRLLLSAALMASAACASRDRDAISSRPAAQALLRVDDLVQEFWSEALSPYGRWISLREHGHVWQPHRVPVGWRPYSYGRWIMTDHGWTWLSSWSWGWGPFHYGRWTHHAHYGWVWQPGQLWAPAWVAWRFGDDWLAWAPLPPEAPWTETSGIDRSLDFGSFIWHEGWSVVPLVRVLETPIQRVALPLRRARILITGTAIHVRYRVHDERLVCQGLSTERLEDVLGRRIEPLEVMRATSANERGVTSSGGQVLIYRPSGRSETATQETRLGPPSEETLPHRSMR